MALEDEKTAEELRAEEKQAQDDFESGMPIEAKPAAKVATAVLGRQIAAAGKRPSDAMSAARAELMEALGTMREGSAPLSTPGKFVLGNATAVRPSEDDDA